MCVSRRPAGADRKPKEFQWFSTVPYVGVGFRGSGSFWMFVDRLCHSCKIIDFPTGLCGFTIIVRFAEVVFILKSEPYHAKACFATVSVHSVDAIGGGFFLKDSLLTVRKT